MPAVAPGSGTGANVDASDLSPDTDSPPPRRAHKDGKFAAQQHHDSRKPVARKAVKGPALALAFKSTGDDMLWLTCSVGQTPRRRAVVQLLSESSHNVIAHYAKHISILV